MTQNIKMYKHPELNTLKIRYEAVTDVFERIRIVSAFDTIWRKTREKHSEQLHLADNTEDYGESFAQFSKQYIEEDYIDMRNDILLKLNFLMDVFTYTHEQLCHLKPIVENLITNISSKPCAQHDLPHWPYESVTFLQNIYRRLGYICFAVYPVDEHRFTNILVVSQFVPNLSRKMLHNLIYGRIEDEVSLFRLLCSLQYDSEYSQEAIENASLKMSFISQRHITALIKAVLVNNKLLGQRIVDAMWHIKFAADRNWIDNDHIRSLILELMPLSRKTSRLLISLLRQHFEAEHPELKMMLFLNTLTLCNANDKVMPKDLFLELACAWSGVTKEDIFEMIRVRNEKMAGLQLQIYDAVAEEEQERS